MSERRHVLIATPAINGKRKPQAQRAIEYAMLEAAGLGFDAEEYLRAQDSMIAQARNVLLGRFIAGPYTDMIWQDADVAFGPGVFSRLMSHRVDFVAAVPRVKHDAERYPVRWLGDGGAWVDPANGLRVAEGVPFGLVRITKACAERMVEAHADKWFMVGDAHHKNWCLFDCVFEDHQYWGEDYVFCRRWRELGGTIHVDAEIPTVHVGRKGAVYAGHLGNWLRAQHQAPHAIDEVAAKLSEPNPDGVAALARMSEIMAGKQPFDPGAEPIIERMKETFGRTDYQKLFNDACGAA